VSRSNAGISKTKLRSSYVTLVVSVSLVLFLLGILGLVIINARELSDYFRESLSFSVILDEDIKEADIRMLKKDLDAKEFVKLTEYISKEDAALKLMEELGEDFISFLGYNPLSPTIDVYLHAGYTNPDSIAVIEKYLLEFPVVSEVYYQESVLHLINENISKIGLFLGVLSLFLFLIALTIINNTVRLSVYSKRFIIRTMQLVGATRGFVRRPFLLKSIFHGLLAAIVSLLLMLTLLYLVEREFFSLFTFENINLLLMLMGVIIITGVLINVVSTFFAVNRYLSISEDKLYI
jgi:cell division transport system permease protein